MFSQKMLIMKLKKIMQNIRKVQHHIDIPEK